MIHLFKKVRRKLFKLFFQKTLPPPTNIQLKAKAELCKYFDSLELESLEGSTPSQAAWQKNMNRLRELVLKGDPFRFLEWDVILNTMFVQDADYLIHEYKTLKSHADWDSKWKSILNESPLGAPAPFRLNFNTSGNLVHNAYHILSFEESSHTSIHNYNIVFEFGGGYGNMCKLFLNLGFKGKYVLFDLPHFSQLQLFYLKCLGIDVTDNHEAFFSNPEKYQVLCLSGTDNLSKVKSKMEEFSSSLMIATWSFSETPMSFRLDNEMPNLTSYLVAYQHTFEDVNNIDFFNNWKQTRNKVKNWKEFSIDHISGNSYLFGF